MASLDARLRMIATGLQRLGIAEALTVPLAYGYCQMLWRATWVRCTDLLGTADEIEERCGWKHPPRTLLSVLLAAGIVGSDSEGRYYDVYAWVEASESQRRRWKRTNESSYLRASLRDVVPMQPLPVESTALEPPPPPPPEPIVDEPPKDLFGNFVEPEPAKVPASTKGKKNGNAKTAHPDLIEYWCSRWSDTEGTKYPFTSRDAAHIAALLKLCDHLEDAKRVIDYYLACKDRWYAGHALGKLIADLPKFKSRRGSAGGGGSEGLRTDRLTNIGDPEAVLREDTPDADRDRSAS